MAIQYWALWEENWRLARAFFKSKGNLKTTARLKKAWHDSFMEACQSIREDERGR
jgi:hypothetical protein